MSPSFPMPTLSCKSQLEVPLDIDTSCFNDFYPSAVKMVMSLHSLPTTSPLLRCASHAADNMTRHRVCIRPAGKSTPRSRVVDNTTWDRMHSRPAQKFTPHSRVADNTTRHRGCNRPARKSTCCSHADTMTWHTARSCKLVLFLCDPYSQA